MHELSDTIGHRASCGEPDAQEWARPVRRAGRGNGPAATPAPRPGSTQPLGASCEVRDPGLLRVQSQPESVQDRRYQLAGLLGLLGLLAGGAQDHQVSRRGESHPPALAEPGVNLSAHRAPIVQPSGRTPQRQCANRPGWRLATSAMNLCARLLWRRNRLYFRMAHLTSSSLKWRKTGYNMDL